MLVGQKLLSLAILLISAVAAAQEATAPKDSAVVKLTSQNFDSYIKENPLVLAEFFAPWCGHCKNLAPHYVKAAEELKDKNITLAQIDCTEDQELCMEHQIRGYPSLKIFKNHDLTNPQDYQGARSSDAIVSYMIKQSLPTVQVIDSQDELDSYLANSTQPVVVDSTGASSFNETFYKVADALYSDFTFLSYPSAKKSLSIYLPAEDAAEEISYKGDVSKLSNEDTIQWLKVESLPYFGEVSGETFAAYSESKLPLAYFFYTSEEEREEYREFFEKLGRKHRGLINFAGLDADKFGRHAENLNMKQQFPLFAIHNMTSNLKYGLDQLSDEEFAKLTKKIKLDTKKITKLVEKFLKGDLEPIVKSEEIPEIQETNVYKLVAKTHDDIVNDESKDVLVKYYAPWCGHCKRLAPIYEQVADIYASNDSSKDKILLAEVDATLNDISSVEIEGYPTILLYPAGNKTPIPFQTQRTVEAFLQFMKENGGHSEIDGMKLFEEYQAKLEEEEEGDEDEDEVDHDEL